MNVSDYPKMKGESRKNYHRNMRKMAYPDGFRKEMSFEELARKLND
jgi:hypothetical protein